MSPYGVGVSRVLDLPPLGALSVPVRFPLGDNTLEVEAARGLE